MRILFLCSSQEAARDGVGDYVRALAGACLHRGHSCAVIALHDPHVEKVVELTGIATGGMSLLRLPTTLDWPGRLERARAFTATFRPDWISLQFVAYGFNGRGLIFRVADIFQKLTAGFRLHLMFHELWIGEGPPPPLRHRLTGILQRIGIKRMVARLNPQTVTTTNPFYQSLLKQAGIPATLLPLFGNIPVAPSAPKLVLPAKLEEVLTAPDPDSAQTWWIGLFFGTLHPEWQSKPLLPRLLNAARQARKRICLVLVGRAGAKGEALWRDLGRHYASDISLVDLGAQSPEVISTLLQISDFGITTTPWQLLGKSGTVAAMLDHGLPVLVPRDDVRSISPPVETVMTDSLLHLCDEELAAKLVRGLPKRPARPRLDEVAAQFLELLA
jgi:hypothetical protein